MAEQQENLEEMGENLEGENGNNPPQKVDPKVLETAERAGAAKMYAKIVQDPDIQKLLTLKNAGKKVSIGEEGASNQQSSQEEAEPNFEEMSEKQRMQWLVKEVSKTTVGVMDQKLAPVTERLEKLDGFASELQKDGARKQVQELQKKYKDFNAMAPRMQELAGEHPTLSAEQLYQLAAQEAGTFQRRESRTSSERPTNSTARPAKKKSETSTPAFGGMRELIAQAAAKNIRANSQVFESDEE